MTDTEPDVGRWLYPDGTPRLPPMERPLKPEMPTPPYTEIDGVPVVLEYVEITEMPVWRKRHRLRWERSAFMGRLGPVNVYWPAPAEE